MLSPGEGSVDFDAMFDEASSPSPAPESPPDTAPPSEPAAPPPEAPAVETPSRQRDEHGRFTQKPETTSPEPTPESAPPAPESPPAATVAAPDVSQYPPFEYPAGNKQYRIEGAVTDHEGNVFFPKTAVQRLHHLLHDAHEAQTLRSNQGRVRADAMREGQEMLQRGQQIMAKMDEVFSQGDVGTEAWADNLIKFALNWAREKPRLDAEARAQIAEEQRKQLEAQMSERQQEETKTQLLPRQYAAVDDWTEKLAASLGFAKEDIAQLQQRYRSPEWFGQLFEEENGELFIIHERIEKDLQQIKRFYRPATPSRPAPPPPPVAAGRGSVPSRPTKPAVPASDAKLSIKDRDKKIFESVFE